MVRETADVDHLTPVIYRWSREHRGPVTVLCMNPAFPLDRDPRMAYLRTLNDVTVAYSYEYHAPTRLQRFAGAALCAAGRRKSGPAARVSGVHRLAGRIIGLSGDRGFKTVMSRAFGIDWARSLLRRTDASLLVFDAPKPYQYNVSALLQAARERGVFTVSLPHGVDILVGELRGANQRRAGKALDLRKRYPFDYFVVPHAAQKEYYVRCGLPDERISVLGSARYCAEWTDQNLALAPELARTDAPDGRLRVLYLDKPTVNNPQAVAEFLTAAADSPDLQVLVCPAVRGSRLTVESVPDGVVVSRESSARLVEWADVVVATASSMLLEVLIRGKLLISPRNFAPDVSTVFTEHEVCLMPKSGADLMALLHDLASGRSAKIDAARVTAFLAEMVYAGDAGADVLGSYVALLEDLAERNVPGVPVHRLEASSAGAHALHGVISPLRAAQTLRETYRT